MYWVQRVVDLVESSTSSSESGWRRHAFGLSAPFAKALAATLASVDSLMPCSGM